MALALDGTSNIIAASSGTPQHLTLTTSNGSDIIVVAGLHNDSGQISSISDVAGLTWTRRKSFSSGGGQFTEEWYAVASSPLSADVITVNFPAASYISLVAFGISGANIGTPYDSNASLPATAASGTVSISTSNANDFLLGIYRFSATATPTSDASWTAIVSGVNSSYLVVEYMIVSATQSSLTIPVGTGAGDEDGGIGDAIQQAAAAASFVPYNPWPLWAPVLSQ